jgi:hypothetical protein
VSEAGIPGEPDSLIRTKPLTSSRPGYLSDLETVLVIALVLICAACGAVAWHLHPQSNGFHAIPQGPRIVTAGSQFQLRETLTPTVGGGATLVVEEPTSGGTGDPLRAVGYQVDPTVPGGALAIANGPIARFDGAALPNQSWDYMVLNPGPSRPCRSAATYREGTVAVPWYKSAVPAFIVKVNRPTALVDNPPLTVVCLQWRSASPVQGMGAYLSARFPPVHGIPVAEGLAAADADAPGDQATGPVTRVLHLTDALTQNFTIQSDPLPTVTNEQSWTWVDHNLPQAVQVAAINASDLQHENNNALYAGVLFGVAGAALIALITELVGPFSRRKSAEPAPRRAA